MFGCCHPSDMGTWKWHLLDHPSEQIGVIDAVQYIHIDLYDGFHKVFEENFEKSFIQKMTAINEINRRHNMWNGCSTLKSIISRTVSIIKLANVLATTQYCADFVRLGDKTNSAALHLQTPSQSSRFEYTLFDRPIKFPVTLRLVAGQLVTENVMITN